MRLFALLAVLLVSFSLAASDISQEDRPFCERYDCSRMAKCVVSMASTFGGLLLMAEVPNPAVRYFAAPLAVALSVYSEREIWYYFYALVRYPGAYFLG